jgi:hypothetical protein
MAGSMIVSLDLTKRLTRGYMSRSSTVNMVLRLWEIRAKRNYDPQKLNEDDQTGPKVKTN